jgi:hypothetical protein
MKLLRWSSVLLVTTLFGCSDPPAAPPQDAAVDVPVADDVPVVDDAPVDDAPVVDARGDDAPDAPVAPAPFSQVQEIFTRTCSTAACHGRGADGGGGSGGLFLTDGTTSYRAMVNQPSDQVPRLRLVEPGHPERSYLVVKIEGSMRSLQPECATSPGRNPCGVQMPQLAAPLSPSERTLIRNWILSGASME